MKHLLLITIAAVVLVGCRPSVNIWNASAEGNIAAVKQHLSSGTDVNAKNDRGSTSLHMADSKEIVELLIAKGADVNAKDKDGGTPLHAAALFGLKENAELLIGKGADVNAQGGAAGLTPLDAAIQMKKTELTELLRKHGGKTGEELEAEGK